MDDGTGEKTEEATPERLRKLRQEGNVPRSQDVVTAVSFLVLFVVIAVLSDTIGGELRELVLLSVRAAFSKEDLEVSAARLLFAGLRTMAYVSGPVLAAAMVVGLAANVAQVGFLFTTKPLVPDLQRVSPARGFRTLFDGKKVVELGKTLLKFTAIVWLSWIALRDSLGELALLVRAELPVTMEVVGGIVWGFGMKIAAAFLVIAAADLFYQRRRYLKDNRMSKYELKQEYRQSEGDPQHKAERRRLHQEILSSSGAAAVRHADVVICNPDHIAIALKYEEGKGSAPEIVAKGNNLWAEKILDAARRYGVPVVRNVPLAHALDRLDVGDEIPEELYEAVAEVLSFVMALADEQRDKAAGGRRAPVGERAVGRSRGPGAAPREIASSAAPAPPRKPGT